METLQVIHVTVELAILIAVVKATITIAKLEFRVELMWKEFNKRMGLRDEDEDES